MLDLFATGKISICLDFRLNGLRKFSCPKRFGLSLSVFVFTLALCACARTSEQSSTHQSTASDAAIAQSKQPQALELSTAPVPQGLEKAILAAGCFWGVERTLQEIPGVKSTTVGYSGGKTAHPTYPLVCEGKTGHAEAVEVIFDPKVISYETLLNKFFDLPGAAASQELKQFHGGQYRSAIFYVSEKQKEIAESVKKERERKLGRKLYTEIEKASDFTVAEDFHQDYLKVRGLKDQCN